MRLPGKLNLKRKRLLGVGLLTLGGIVVWFWCGAGHKGAPARLEVLSRTPTNGGEIVRFRLVPAEKGQYMAFSEFKLGYDERSSMPGLFSCEPMLSGIYSGPRDFNIVFPTNYPVWRLQVEVSGQASLLRRVRWCTRFTVERLRGFGWLPTPDQFFALLDVYRSFSPGLPKTILSEEVAIRSSLVNTEPGK